MHSHTHIYTHAHLQAWCSVMFDKKVVGLVGASATGWGKVGTSIGYLTLPAIYNSFQTYNNNEWAWRFTLVVPACLTLVVSVATWILSDSVPEDDERVAKEKELEEANNPVKDAQPQNKVCVYVCCVCM
jgi:nitrate/nitrite transporter NarK